MPYYNRPSDFWVRGYSNMARLQALEYGTSGVGPQINVYSGLAYSDYPGFMLANGCAPPSGPTSACNGLLFPGSPGVPQLGWGGGRQFPGLPAFVPAMTPVPAQQSFAPRSPVSSAPPQSNPTRTRSGRPSILASWRAQRNRIRR